jgi:non-ribosomal peptide synthetase-like protein
LAKHIASVDESRDENRTAEQRRTSRDVFDSIPAYQRFSCVALQALSIPFLYGLVLAPFLISGLTFLAMYDGDIGTTLGTVVIAALILTWYPLRLAMSIGLKWLIIGRYSPGKHPVWGLYYFRFWLVDRIHNLGAVGLLSGTPAMSLYYRLMGARIGRHSIIDTPFCGAFDLVTVGEDTCIGSETHLLGYRIEEGYLVLDRVEIGSRCFVGIHSCIGLDTRMEDDSRLGDLSLLADGETICAGDTWHGSPAEPGGVPVPEPGDEEVRRRPFLFGVMHFVLVGLLWLFLFVTVIPGLAVVVSAFALGGSVWGVASVFLAVPVNTASFCLFVAALKALVLRRVKPGTYRIESWLFLRKWFVDALMNISRVYMHAVYTTIYLPPWLRMMGARIGRLAEISTVSQVTPDLIEIADGSFFADGSMIGGRRFFRGQVQFSRNRIGRRSFVGNNAILPIGTNLGEHCLLGVLSTPPERRETTPAGSEWLGSPSFSLPHRQKVEGFDPSVTYAPTRRLYAQRLIIDAIRIVTPGIITWFAGLAFFTLLEQGWLHLSLWAICLLAPLAAFAIAVAAALCVVAVKKVVMGRFEPVIKPLWSRYVWWNEVVNGAHETAGAPALSPLVGTLLFNRYLRLIGCKIGEWAYVGTTLFSEFDLVDIGDYAALNAGVVVQNHLFEDRIMKSSYLKIGDECSVGNMSVILYDSEMKQGSTVSPLSLLMKGESIPERSRWIGIPTRRLTG